MDLAAEQEAVADLAAEREAVVDLEEQEEREELVVDTQAPEEAPEEAQEEEGLVEPVEVEVVDLEHREGHQAEVEEAVEAAIPIRHQENSYS